MTENNESRWTAGRVSLILFGIFVVLITGLTIAGAVTSCEAMNTQPCPNPAGSTAGWIGAMVFIGLGLPLIGVTFITSIYAIAQNKGRNQGLVTLISSLLLAGVMAMIG